MVYSKKIKSVWEIVQIVLAICPCNNVTNYISRSGDNIVSSIFSLTTLCHLYTRLSAKKLISVLELSSAHLITNPQLVLPIASRVIPSLRAWHSLPCGSYCLCFFFISSFIKIHSISIF